jgi:transposase
VAQARLAAHQKGAHRTGRAVAFVDEARHTFRARLGATWAPIGRPLVLRRLSQRREVSSSVALQAPLDGPPRLYARHFRGSIHGERVIAALRYFPRQIGRPLLVIWDRLQAHRARPVQDFLAAHPDDYQVEWLPSYAPEVNPEELCNGRVKRDLLNAVPASVNELHRLACRSFRRLGRRTDLLDGVFRHAGFPVTGSWRGTLACLPRNCDASPVQSHDN